jgi:DNA invertase Pin-like site-specific DNA recombinase
VTIGYARVSTAKQDLASQRAGLASLGIDEKRVYVDHGLTGTNRGVRLNMANPSTSPAIRSLFTVLSLITEFEADLARARGRGRDRHYQSLHGLGRWSS